MFKKNLVPVCAAGLGFVLLAGCGSSSSTTPSTAIRKPSPSSPVTSPSAPPASLAQLQKIVLQAGDLSGSWKGTPYKADRSDSAHQAEMVKCVGARNTEPNKVAEAHSSKFALGGAGITSDAASYRSQSDIDSDVAMLLSPKFKPCYEKEMRKSFVGSSVTLETVSFDITAGSAGGPANVVATGTGIVKANVKGRSVSLYTRIAFISGPLVAATVDGTNVGLPITASQMESMVAAVATRTAKG